MNAMEVKLFNIVFAGFIIVGMCGLSSCYIDKQHKKQIKNLQDRVAEIEKNMNKEDAE